MNTALRHAPNSSDSNRVAAPLSRNGHSWYPLSQGARRKTRPTKETAVAALRLLSDII